MKDTTRIVYAYNKLFLDEYGGCMHLATERGGVMQPLNSGFGILAASADFTREELAGQTKILVKPWVFRMADGGFGVLALRRGIEQKAGFAGKQNVQENQVMLFTSKDLMAYSLEQLLQTTADEAEILDIACTYQDGAYRLLLETGAGLRVVTTRDFLIFAPAETKPEEGIHRVATGIEDADAACGVALTDEEYEALITRLLPLEHIGVKPIRLEVAVGGPVELPPAQLQYSDGSVFEMPVSWPRFLAEEPGEYTLKGTLAPEEWAFPLMPERGDPMAIHYKGSYYFMATDDEHGQKRLNIRKVSTLSEIPSAKDHTILSANDSGEMSDCFWAPELHQIDQRLFLFFACGSPHWYTVQSHVMELVGEDPLNPADWSKPMRCKRRDGSYLIKDGITLDMTVLLAAGETYVLWAQRVMHMDKGEMSSSDLYIAKVDPQKPWRQASEAVLLRRCQFSWERIGTEVLEGPFVVKHGGRIYVSYAAAMIDHTYCVGMLFLEADNDPLDVTAWQVSNFPLVHRYSVPDQIGAGHNSFVKDAMGNDVLMIHAIPMANYLNNPQDMRRYPAFRRVHWDQGGYPRLDMHPKREIAERFRHVIATIIVR